MRERIVRRPTERQSGISFTATAPHDIGETRVLVEKSETHRKLTVGGLEVHMTKAQARELAKTLW